MLWAGLQRLIKFTLHIFQENEAIRLKWQKRLEYIMIDEFQDIDGLQYGLMEVLCAITGICSSWVIRIRPSTPGGGPTVKYLLDFDKQFPAQRPS